MVKGSIVETWKIGGVNRRFYVKRDAGGHIVTKRAVKGSNLTKEEANEIFSTNSTFDKSVKIDKIPDSKKTIQLNSGARPKNVPRRFQQLVISVLWRSENGRRLGETTGYSKLLSKQNDTLAEEQALNFATAEAITNGLINYTDSQNYEIIQKWYQSYTTKYSEEKKQAAA